MPGSSNESWDLRLQEVIESHIKSLRDDFQRLIGELPLQPPAEADEGMGDALARLKQSVDSIHTSSGQRDMAERLLSAAAGQAARVALFLVKTNDIVHGYESRGFAPPQDRVDGFQTIPGSTDPLAAVLSRRETCHIPGSSLAGSTLANWLEGQMPTQVCLAPLSVGGRTVAVLYADSGPEAEGGFIRPEAIEILASVAALYLERLRHRQPATPPVAAGPTALSDAATPVSEVSPTADDGAEPQQQADPPPPADDAAARDDVPSPDSHAGPPSLEETIPLSDWMGTAAAEGTETDAAPVLPAAGDVGMDARLEEDARRFARLLVSEIVLYNEAQVKAGQKHGDLYRRLKESVDRSREAYEERFGNQTSDLFEEELIRSLALGDPSLMGPDYRAS